MAEKVIIFCDVAGCEKPRKTIVAPKKRGGKPLNLCATHNIARLKTLHPKKPKSKEGK